MLCGTHQEFTIESKPKGAESSSTIATAMWCSGQTPWTASIRRAKPEEGRANYIVLIRKDGYAPMQIPIVGKVNNAYLAMPWEGFVGLRDRPND